LPALLFGVAVGNIYAGIPMDSFGNYVGIPLFGLITPFTLLTGLLGFCLILGSGASWAALKAPLPSELQVRAAKLRTPLQIVCLVLFVVVTIYALVIVNPTMEEGLAIPRIIFAALFVVAIVAAIVLGKQENADLKVFLAHSASMVALVALLACSMFPVLVNATPDSIGPAITISTAASSELSLMWMTIIACIGVPLVLVYHVIIYRTFRGRVKVTDLEHY
jgi:cytochrome d ubiquinol oxidase subunit II